MFQHLLLSLYLQYKNNLKNIFNTRMRQQVNKLTNLFFVDDDTDKTHYVET